MTTRRWLRAAAASLGTPRWPRLLVLQSFLASCPFESKSQDTWAKGSVKGMVWIWSLIFKAPKSKHILQGLPNNGLKLNKRRPKHVSQGLFTESSATLSQGTHMSDHEHHAVKERATLVNHLLADGIRRTLLACCECSFHA